MDTSMLVDFTILIIAFGSSFLIMGYEQHARMRGWPVGAWLSGDAPPLKFFGFLTMLLSLGVSFYVYPWWSPITVLILGVSFGFIASELLRQWVQFLAIFGSILGWILCLTVVL
jgi:hypothetical protein